MVILSLLAYGCYKKKKNEEEELKCENKETTVTEECKNEDEGEEEKEVDKIKAELDKLEQHDSVAESSNLGRYSPIDNEDREYDFQPNRELEQREKLVVDVEGRHINPQINNGSWREDSSRSKKVLNERRYIPRNNYHPYHSPSPPPYHFPPHHYDHHYPPLRFRPYPHPHPQEQYYEPYNY